LAKNIKNIGLRKNLFNIIRENLKTMKERPHTGDWKLKNYTLLQ